MKICVYGAGSIGGIIGGVLAEQGHDVSLIARGDHLAALQKSGCTIDTGEKKFTVHPACSDDPAELGPQDAVVIAVKAPALLSVAAGIAPLLGPETTVIPAMNGIPWWFFDGFPADGPEIDLPLLDPDGDISSAIDPGRIIGCVVHMGAVVPEPGVIRRAADNRLILGEPSGERSARVTEFAALFDATFLDVTVTENLRQEIWLKLLGNFNFAPISSLTGASNGEIGADPGLRKLAGDMFAEAASAGDKLGLDPGMTADERTDLGASMGDFRTSMLQDFDRSRPPEIDTIVGAVVEIGRATGTAMPISEAVLALLKQKARGLGLC
jgi:2-dehydropantoate 2-reductase